MNKIINLTLGVALLGLTACSDGTMDEINVNNENPAQNSVPANIQITDAMMNTAMNAVSGDYAFYASVINEQSVGTGNNQFMKAELRNASELAAPSTFNNGWEAVYVNLENLKQCIDKVDNDIASSGSYTDVKGAAMVLYVINFQILTDLHGSIPYTDALKGLENMQPSVQSQKEVYTSLLTTIDEAITILKNAVNNKVTNMGSQDIMFKGNVKKWLALAYAEKARLWIHQTNVNTDAAKNALEAANAAIALNNIFTSDGTGAKITDFNGDATQNPWAAFIDSRGYNAPSKTVVDLMGTLDPRRAHYITTTAPDNYFANPNYYGYTPGEYATPGNETYTKKSWTTNISEWYYMFDEPVHIFSAYELYFIKAEAEARLNDGNYISSLQTAIKLSVDDIDAITYCNEAPGATYAATFAAKSTQEEQLKQIFAQKYIAFCNDEQVEAYNDLRRVMGEKKVDDINSSSLYVPMTNPYNWQGNGTINRWPYSLPYGSSSINNNPAVKELFGDGSYIYSKKLWLFGGAE